MTTHHRSTAELLLPSLDNKPVKLEERTPDEQEKRSAKKFTKAVKLIKRLEAENKELRERISIAKNSEVMQILGSLVPV